MKRQTVGEKEHLMRFATHEIGTPLSQLSWTCQNLLSSSIIKRDDSVYSSVQQMYVSIVTLGRRITNLLHVADLTESLKLKKDKVDIIPLIKEAIENHKVVSRIKNISIDTVSILPEKAFALGDAEYFNIVFSNLIAHALYYAKQFKSILVEYADIGEFHQVRVTSIGDSLSKEEVNSLFSAYYKGEPLSWHTESTGLGLFLVQKIVTLYGGSVTASSDPRGVTITVTLPKV